MNPQQGNDRQPRLVGPWGPSHLVRFWVANGIGVMLVFAGWWQASGSSSAGDQLRWLNLSLLGFAVAGGANGYWLARTRRVVGLLRLRVLPHPPGPPRGRRPDVAPEAGYLVAGPNMSRYHQPRCLLVAEKQVTGTGRPDHERAGRTPCEVCQP